MFMCKKIRKLQQLQGHVNTTINSNNKHRQVFLLVFFSYQSAYFKFGFPLKGSGNKSDFFQQKIGRKQLYRQPETSF